ncbi:sensor histidine kinase [Lacibacter sp.]|uniref:sensor histidine kinase n=1 Tax=Lacibacter sp. TaxID=1915409 RepID=UPI002B4AE53B|nr:ATP-binding protein [Lacibacter sp.]HLP39549.1 ATP-binding protein [Lacibacter sp.]
MSTSAFQNASIRFSTQIIKRLGEELNPSIDQSILELVKNSYDADATTCTVTLSNVSAEGGTVTIEDDGDGMDGSAIKNSYLVLGQSEKSFSKRTRLNRIPAGSKGLGRLAALRMGTAVELESVPLKVSNKLNKTKQKFAIKIDWNKFDSAKLVDDVIIRINSSKVSPSKSSSTTVSIKHLKNKVTERDIKKVARGLILLADPFDDDPDAFKPVLKAPEFKELEKLVTKRYFDDADYHLSAVLDKDGNASAEILDYKGKVLFKATHKEITVKRKNKKYNCPVTTFDLWAFILNSTSFSTRSTSLGEVKEWLNEFGGVHVYENGLRVNPYGNQGNDWLDMNLSRARSPEERPSTNTSIGVTRIRDSKGLLKQKTDRSGFIEDDVFHEIKNFCQDALEWMAKKRLEIAEKKRAKSREQTASESTNSKEKVKEQINKLRTNDRVQLVKAFESYDKAVQSQVNTLKAEVQLYRTLSTAGITAATFSHESNGNPIKVIKLNIDAIERRSKKFLVGRLEENQLSKPIGLIRRAINSLAVLGTATLKLLSNEKRRITRVEVHDIIKNTLETFTPFLNGRDIKLRTELAKGTPYLRGSEAALESIFTNLLNNSLVAIENANPSERAMLIKTEIQEDVLVLTVSDNGTGIEGIALKDIWLPGQTTNPNGTGLGLTIVRDAVMDLGGSVRANRHGVLGGADLIVELPIIGK